jgi:hypothetical protein
MSTTWAKDNQRYTAVAMSRVAALLSGDGCERGDAGCAFDLELEDIATSMARPPALTSLLTAFGLSPFESDLLVMCAGVELDEGIRQALARHDSEVPGTGRRPAPTFGLALAELPDPHWSALTPASSLRRWRLVELGPGPVLTESPLHISERVLHYLAGVHYVDDASGVRQPTSTPELAHGQATVARNAAAVVAAATDVGPPLVQILTRRRGTGQAIAGVAGAALGLAAGVVRVEDIPANAAERRDLARLIERESVLAGLLPVIDAVNGDREGLASAARLAEEIGGPVMLVVREPVEVQRDDVRLPVPPATPDERLAAWIAALGPAGELVDGQANRAAELFDLDPAAIRATATEFSALTGTRCDTGGDAAPDLAGAFWDLARSRARPRLEHLTERVTWSATWEMLVLPESQKDTIREIAAQARWRGKVHREWGFGADSGPGLGISVLFYGPSGTGKSMAAGVIANELGLDLYRIDLSRVVSKYIGETEKNLGTVFDEAEGAGAVLLFDEADALFGRRSEVKDSHDRYANLEVSYLLQRMEAYDGLAILTTNQRSALDPAFLRRLRFAVQFPFPDPAGRAEIWRRVFPETVPTVDLDVDRLAQLNVAGGNIRTMALNAAFHAAAGGTDVQMDHILLAAKAEFAKLERPLPEAQVRGWT